MTGPPSIRFYAGAPLVTSNGMRLGSLCVIDVKPRNLDAEQLMVLANFAEVVVREIEKDIARVRPCRLPSSCPNCGQQDACWQRHLCVASATKAQSAMSVERNATMHNVRYSTQVGLEEVCPCRKRRRTGYAAKQPASLAPWTASQRASC